MNLEDASRWAREERLTPLAQVSTGTIRATVMLDSMPATIEGYIQITNGEPGIVVSDRLDTLGLETAILHEAGHWLERHEHELAMEYADARSRGMADPTFVRLEQNADRRAIALLDEVAVRARLQSEISGVRAGLIRDAEQYGRFER